MDWKKQGSRLRFKIIWRWISTSIEHLKERRAQHPNKDRLLIAIKDMRRIARATPVERKSLYAVFFITRIEYTNNMWMFTALFAFHLPLIPGLTVTSWNHRSPVDHMMQDLIAYLICSNPQHLQIRNTCNWFF